MSDLHTDAGTTTPEHGVTPETMPMVPSPARAKELLRDNLFKDAKNSILTIVFGAILVYVLYRAFGFMFLNEKIDQDGVARSGWEVIRDGPLLVYMIGNRFNQAGIAISTLWAGIYVLSLGFALLAGANRSDPDRIPASRGDIAKIVAPATIGIVAVLIFTTTITPTLLTLGVIAVFIAGQRIPEFLPDVVTRRTGAIGIVVVLLGFLTMTGFNPGNINFFGGLLLSVTVAFTAIVLCFPIGVILALVRRSSFPLLRPIAVAYIELIRGVPLISLLFLGAFGLGFLFPPGMNPPGQIATAIIIFTGFTAAYVAEDVRSGLQSVPDGQTEAGQAVGLSPLTVTRKIVLPQALRNTIPSLVGQFISVLKDTSLLIIIGQQDLFGVTKPILANLRFTNQGFASEAYAFVALIFWVICFSMSRAAKRLETRLGVGTR